MIKFNCLIHKETGTVIKYEDWLDMHYSHSTIELIKRCYDSDQMLFGSDFEIIYESEFTVDELKMLKESLGFSLDEDLIDSDGYSLIKKIDLNMELNMELRCKNG